ncbi:MAG: hypothetical protein ACYCOO_06170 [Chitinophagaceae bacterium]
MHDIEPFYNWRHLYTTEEDEWSPFFGRQYNELEFTQTIYNYFIHPQWDNIGSQTLYLKILFVDYNYNYAILEFLGEWNDAIENDIMTLKREVIEMMVSRGIYKYILIAENILNFHSSDDCYYEEWLEDIRDFGGWVVGLNMPEQTRQEFCKAHLDRYLDLLEIGPWRTFQPQFLFQMVDNLMVKRLDSR